MVQNDIISLARANSKDIPINPNNAITFIKYGSNGVANAVKYSL
jgi:hypothetical protein